MLVGLTGGIGCGKSTAGRIWGEQGFQRIDVDEIVRQEVLTDREVVRQIAAHFGPAVLNQSGAIDRAQLGARVFGAPEELRWLEALTHPEVSRRWRARIAAEPSGNWLVEVPLLFEKGLEKGFDFVACVACSYPIQIARLEQRGMERTLAEQRISQQMPLARKIELSDFVLSNDGALPFLRHQVVMLATRLLAPR